MWQLYWLVACMSIKCTKMSQAKQNLQHDGLNPKGTEECRERNPSTATHIQYTHTIRNTHHPHVSALSSCIQACWGRPQACDCVRGEFWVANSIWTEDPILRCQYSPHYLCSLLIQGRGGGKHMLNKNVSFNNAKNKCPSGSEEMWHKHTLWTNDITQEQSGGKHAAHISGLNNVK